MLLLFILFSLTCMKYIAFCNNPNEPQEEYQEETSSDVYVAKLTVEELEGESAQDSVGENQVMNLLKELEVARKEKSGD